MGTHRVTQVQETETEYLYHLISSAHSNFYHEIYPKRKDNPNSYLSRLYNLVSKETGLNGFSWQMI